MNEQCHHIKTVEMLNSATAIINGNEFIKTNRIITKMKEHVINHIHIKIHGHYIGIYGNMCLMCGDITKDQITSHHVLPNQLNAKYNVFVPLRKHCHNQLNSDSSA